MFKRSASFATAMGLFSKAREELKLAQASNNAILADARATVAGCEKEAADIDRATGFLDSILTGEAPAAKAE